MDRFSENVTGVKSQALLLEATMGQLEYANMNVNSYVVQN